MNNNINRLEFALKDPCSIIIINGSFYHISLEREKKYFSGLVRGGYKGWVIEIIKNTPKHKKGDIIYVIETEFWYICKVPDGSYFENNAQLTEKSPCRRLPKIQLPVG